MSARMWFYGRVAVLLPYFITHCTREIHPFSHPVSSWMSRINYSMPENCMIIHDLLYPLETWHSYLCMIFPCGAGILYSNIFNGIFCYQTSGHWSQSYTPGFFSHIL